MTMEHERIYDWNAYRAGGAMTVIGKTREGNPRKIVGVNFIRPGGLPEGNRVLALDRDGVKYVLALTSQD